MKKKIFTLLTLLLCLCSGVSATITATWDFAGNSPEGIQSATNYGYNVVANINSSVDGVSLYVNTGTNGKFSMNGGTQYIQMNAGTIVRVPVVSTNDIVTISFAGNNVYCTISSPYTATADDVKNGYVEFGVSESSTYINSISVELAYTPATYTTVLWDWENNNPSGIQDFTTYQKNATETGSIPVTVNEVVYSLGVDCSTGGKFGPNNGTPQFTTGAKLQVPVTSTLDKITVKRYGTSTDGLYISIGENNYSSLSFSYNPTSAEVSQGYVVLTSGCQYLYSIKLEKLDYFTTATIGSTGWATFSNIAPVDFTNLSGVVSAAIVTGNDGNAINTTAVTGTAAAGTGLLLNAAAGTYSIPVATTGTDYSGSNKLVAVSSEKTVSTESGYTNYVLASVNDAAVFQYISGTSATVGAGKAYLHLPVSAGAPMLFIDQSTTGINKVEAQEAQQKGEYYNLAGQRVAQPTKGLYIVNGKKVIIK